MSRHDAIRPDVRPRARRVAAKRRLGRVFRWLKPSQRSRWTRAGLGYLVIWLGLLFTGLTQQINLLLLTAGLAAGPIVASFFISSATLRKLSVSRRVPGYVFEGEPLAIDYTLENRRRTTAVLALELVDELAPLDRSVPGAARLVPRVLFERVPPGGQTRLRWQTPSPARGQYAFGSLDMITRSPFGLLERGESIARRDHVVIYPRIGRLSRRWQLLQRESTETRRGRRHDRTAQQQEYHGLREYRPGDSMRWIHWRTTARLGRPMVKEFEQQHDQELAILLDPWLPRTKVTGEQREALESAVRFAATVCYETCRQTGRRLLLGWTGAAPGVRQGPASVKLLHELLESLAVLRGSPEGQLSALLDAMPPAPLREALIVVVATRPVNLAEEVGRSSRLADASQRNLAGRIVVLDAARGDLAGLIDFEHLSSVATDRPRLDGGGPSPNDETTASEPAQAAIGSGAVEGRSGPGGRA